MTTEMREFASGATRNSNESKLDYEGFLSPLVLERFAQYMHGHRKQADGKLRDGDNWQRGMTLVTYMKSKLRHDADLHAMHRGIPRNDEFGQPWTKENLCCAIMFNTMGYLFELLMEVHPELLRPVADKSDDRKLTSDKDAEYKVLKVLKVLKYGAEHCLAPAKVQDNEIVFFSASVEAAALAESQGFKLAKVAGGYNIFTNCYYT